MIIIIIITIITIIFFLFIYLFIYLFMYLFIYSFWDSWIRGYVPETEIHGIMTSEFPRKFQVPISSILCMRWCKLICNLGEISLSFVFLFKNTEEITVERYVSISGTIDENSLYGTVFCLWILYAYGY